MAPCRGKVSKILLTVQDDYEEQFEEDGRI